LIRANVSISHPVQRLLGRN